MDSIEITGKSVDDARKAAASKLKVDDPQSLVVTVLEETKGLFGKTNVRIRAEVDRKASAAPATAAAPAAAPEPAAAASKPAAPKAATTRGGGRKPAPAPAPEPEPTDPEVLEDVQDVMDAPPPAEVTEEAAPKRGRSRGGRGRGGAKEESSDAVPATDGKAAEGDAPSDVQATEDDANALLDLVRGLLEKADLDVDVSTSEVSGRYVTIKLDGKDAAHLVGKHGEVLNALQYLVNIIGARRLNNGVRATLDGNDYRRRREEALTDLATKIAEQVQERGEEAVLDALPAFERRIVHKALSELKGITTYSEGEEPNRRVVIAPAE